MVEAVESSAPEAPEATKKPESFVAKQIKRFLRSKPSIDEIRELILQGGFRRDSKIVGTLLEGLVSRTDFSAEDLFRLATDRHFPEADNFWGEHGLVAKKFGAAPLNDQVRAMDLYLNSCRRFDKHDNAGIAFLFGLLKLPAKDTNAHLMVDFIRQRISSWMTHCQPPDELRMNAEEWLVLLEAVKMFAAEVASEDVKVAPTTAESGSVAE